MQQRTWSCSLEFELTAGHFSHEAESNLTKQQVRRSPVAGQYVFGRRLEAEDHRQAVLAFDAELSAVLRRYGVGWSVFAVQVVESEVAGRTT